MKVMSTLSTEAAQGALAIVQRKVYAPVAETVTLVVAELALTKLDVPGPLNKVQEPLPTVGVLPAKAAVRPQTLASLPAFEVLGGALTVTLIWSSLAVQGALEMVHLNT